MTAWPRHLHDLVLVKWLDAAGDRERGASDPVPCLSVGWIVELEEMDGQKYLKLATELNLSQGAYGTLEYVAISQGMIQQIIPLKPKLPPPFDRWPGRKEKA